MRRLILIVNDAAVIDVADLVERIRVIEFHLLRWMRMLVAEIALNTLHPLVPGMSFESVHHSESAAFRHQAQTRIDHAKDCAVFECLMKVSLRPQFVANP